MNIHYLQHVPFEGPEQVSAWAEQKGHQLRGSLLYENGRLPSTSEFDMLVILGGPMGAYDEERFLWLGQEKKLIQESVRRNKLVLGICLGAQLLAEALGGRVYRNEEKEIGWYPVTLTEESRESSFFQELPDIFVPFHWHGDTFALPPGAKHIARSAGCVHQAFEYADCAIGLQFHLESSESSIRRLIQHCPGDIGQGRFIQRPEDMVGQAELLDASNAILFLLLDALEKKYGIMDKSL
ncbi:type 1 glutamine amidotransferase [Paenibacillus melissococcoides]|uniref:Type 1 glutamine amidotransferase n=1 Tax=Paenibacillus melissococcoides TaxID=2912268 RepID=A0ABM9FWP6_9BACL|nr:MULTISPECIES: type 1 glutamine amidotransferase [Paenibacillus]MEB9895932.1 type 1 glutamine amidotransferase [Bacillus cereus]CAH8243402.1 type 1 glutamine amidotransferase [Paenibacillus melissococcoides]CAH8704407.1 type 1 glutamine amidotransferase [Paenibacillus melissococcoides]CAH8707676.1 type 1 glutamine amidotransferase [Paenibacillus melissococcoides]GIO80248.1 amidotransferase [Paenibacillus dendritiformis]